jgi:hypothetical protein
MMERFLAAVIHRRALTASAVEKTRSEPGMMKLNGIVRQT